MLDTDQQIDTDVMDEAPEEYGDIHSAMSAFDAKLANHLGADVSAEADETGSDAPAAAGSDDESATESEGAVHETKPEELHDEGDKLRHQDYTRKTQELAEQRRQVDAERQQYQQAIQHALAIVNSGQDPILSEKVDWQKLAQEDPATYVAKKAAYEARYAQVQQMQAQAQEYQKQQMTQVIQAEKPKLLAVVPEWKDATVAKKEMTEVLSYLSKNGYSQDDVNNLYDHRAVAIARKAWLYDQHVKAQKSLADKKVPAAPVRVTKPGNGEAVRSPNPAVRDLRSKLAKTGRMDDAIALLDAKLAAKA